MPAQLSREWEFQVTAQAGRREGEDRVLAPDQESAIRWLICEKHPEQLKMEFALWSRAGVMQLIEREHCVRLLVRGVGNLPEAVEIPLQKPIRRAYKQRPEAVQK